MKLKDMSKNDLPRERLLLYGPQSLSNEELVSIILKNGTKNISVKELAIILLSNYKNINELKYVTINTLTKIKGIGKVKAIELIASLELGKRVYYKNNKDKIKLNNTKKVFEYFKDIFDEEKQENFYVVCLDTKTNLISYKLLFKGTINTSCVHPREIFKYAILDSASSIIVLHNHPSGDSTPSIMDKDLTNHLYESGDILGIPLIDHIILGDNNYYSFYESMHKT